MWSHWEAAESLTRRCWRLSACACRRSWTTVMALAASSFVASAPPQLAVVVAVAALLPVELPPLAVVVAAAALLPVEFVPVVRPRSPLLPRERQRCRAKFALASE